MKKFLKTVLISAVLLSATAITAFADMGSKPKVNINLKNLPDETVYIDLLFQPEYPQQLYSNIDPDDGYDSNMIKLLASFNEYGWYAACAQGTYIPMFGDIIPQEDKISFGYFGVPDRFRVIIVTENGEIKTTDTIERKSMEVNMTLDCRTMEYTTKPLWQVYAGQFAITCCVTLLVEGLILLLFRYNLKKRFKYFTVTNVLTQIFFSIVFSAAFIYGGTINAIMFFIPAEIAVVLVEIVIYRKKLKQHGKSRRTWYAITANLTTAVLTFAAIDPLMDVMFDLMR